MADGRSRGERELALLHLDDEELRSPVPPVPRIDVLLQSRIDAMLRFLRRTGYPAVAAPQLGLRLRVLAVDLSGAGRSAVVLINPVVRAVSVERVVDLEGCLSLPGVVARMARPQRIRIEGRARTGQRATIEAGGLLARILQHKLEHLDGEIFLDRLPSSDRAAVLEGAGRRWPSCRLPSRRPGVAGAA